MPEHVGCGLNMCEQRLNVSQLSIYCRKTTVEKTLNMEYFFVGGVITSEDKITGRRHFAQKPTIYEAS